MVNHGLSKYLQDVAPCQTITVSMALMDWLGSQILIVIENVWSIMEVKLKRDHIVTSPDKLGIHQADGGEKSPPPVPVQEAGPQPALQDQDVLG